MGDPDRRRRRLRHHSDPDPGTRTADGSTASTAGVHDGDEPPPPRRRGHGGDDRDGERGLRGLVGSGSSQVGLSAALRARDAARPTDDDLAEAEARVVVVRRNWVPREDLPRSPR
ncbi:hypothetical protein ABZS77_29695 [Micromonospora sp. NPDC005298]|uniref:hypothetical protein n=1 Tax=Micromonospora sp. NPDC005298 TaxID=3156873 RepID=UPI0033AED3D4